MSEPQVPASSPTSQTAGRRKRSNPWLAHVKDTMRKNRGVSFKNVLKIAKKSFKKAKKSRSKSQTQTQNQTQNQNQSQRGGKKYKKRGGFKLGQEQQQQEQQQQQQGGSGVGGGKEGAATMADRAAPVA